MMCEDFDSVLEPGDVWSRRALSDAEESNLVTQHVLQVEVRRQDDLSSLPTYRQIFIVKTLSYESKSYI